MYKKLIYMLLCMVILTLPISSFAASYIGAGYFAGNVDYADKKVGMFDDIRPTGGVVRLGTYLKPRLAVEVRYMSVSGEESASGDRAGNKVDFDLTVASGLIKADLPKTGKAQLYGLLGWSSVHLKAPNISDRLDGVTFGGGMEVDVTKNTFASIEYNHIINVELCDVSGFTILFNGRF